MNHLDENHRPRRQFQRALCIMLALLLALLLQGCGDGHPAALDSALEADSSLTVKAGMAETGAAVFTMSDLPVTTGTRLEYLASDPGSDTSVDLSLAGPWDLTDGPRGTTLETEYVDPDEAPVDASFPDAGLVTRYHWSNGSEPDEYIFQSVDESAWRVYGRADDAGGITELGSAARVLLFPLTGGGSWSDRYDETRDGEPVAVEADHLVLGYDRLQVPAGDFNAFLVQTRVTETGAQNTRTAIVYTWFVPGIGRAAEAVSLPGERDEDFTTASAIYRLSGFREA